MAAAEAGAEKVREGKERAQQRSAFREHDFDGGGDGRTPRRQPRDVCARLGRCCVEGEFQQQPPQQLDGVALLAMAAAAARRRGDAPAAFSSHGGASHYQHHHSRALHKLSAAPRRCAAAATTAAAAAAAAFGGCCALAPLFILSFRGSYIQNDLKTSEKRIVFLVLLQITLKKW